MQKKESNFNPYGEGGPGSSRSMIGRDADIDFSWNHSPAFSFSLTFPSLLLLLPLSPGPSLFLFLFLFLFLPLFSHSSPSSSGHDWESTQQRKTADLGLFVDADINFFWNHSSSFSFKGHAQFQKTEVLVIRESWIYPSTTVTENFAM